MSHFLRVLLPMALALVAGCSPTLYTDAPLGEPARLDASDWNGLWLDADGDLYRMQLGVPGTKDLAVTGNWRECEMSQAGPWEDAGFGEMRRHGEWYFPASFESCEGRLATGEPCRYWITVRRYKEILTIGFPDEAHIRKLLDEGKVPGRIEILPSGDRHEERVVLLPRTDDHYKELFNPLTGAFPATSFVAVRLPAELDPCSKQPK